MASKVFQQVSPSETGELGELEWLEFRHAIYVIAKNLGLKEVYGVAAADLEVPKSLRKSKSKLREWDKFDLCTTSKLCLRREMGQMQRQLNAMANRAKETTSCQFAAYGHGVTTGKHKVSVSAPMPCLAPEVQVGCFSNGEALRPTRLCNLCRQSAAHTWRAYV